MISNIFQSIGEAVKSFIGVITDALSSITPIFWTAGTSDTAGSFTFLGSLLLIGAGVGLVYWVIYLIMRFMRVNTK